MNNADHRLLDDFYDMFKRFDEYKDQIDIKETIKMIDDFRSRPEDQFKEGYQDNYIITKMGQTFRKLMGAFLYNIELALILEAVVCAKQVIYRNVYASFIPYKSDKLPGAYYDGLWWGEEGEALRKIYLWSSWSEKS